MKKAALVIAKYALPIIIIGWLLSSIDRQQLADLAARPKNWLLLSTSLALVLVAVCIQLVRWYLLVRALEIPFRLREAFRLGFLCQLLNFVGIGSIGGDLFKAFFIARDSPGQRALAVSTVIVDRVFGLSALLVTASTAILLSDFSSAPPTIQVVCNSTLVAAGVMLAMLTVILMPGLNAGRATRWLVHLPKVGPAVGHVATALRLYRSRPGVLAISALISISIHCLLALSIYLISISLYDHVPTVADHFVIVPLSLVAGALPITPAGLGTFELAFEQLFQFLPRDPGGEGIIVALAYRVMTIISAAIGMVYYWSSRKEVQELLHEAEEQQMHAAERPDASPIHASVAPGEY